MRSNDLYYSAVTDSTVANRSALEPLPLSMKQLWSRPFIQTQEYKEWG